MIILAIGMPRAGSGWHYNFIKEVMSTTDCVDARLIREQYGLQKILTEVNCNIGVLSLRRLMMVSVPAIMGKTFVIKAHSGPTIWVKLLIKAGLVKPLYIYRDPRDAMLSAQEYGARVLEKQGRPNAFSHLDDFNKALAFFEEYVADWKSWLSTDGVLATRYEDFLSNFEQEAARIVHFLNVDPASPAITEIIKKNMPTGSVQAKQGTHFFKGQIGRFRERYSMAEQQTAWDHFGDTLIRMGYEK